MVFLDFHSGLIIPNTAFAETQRHVEQCFIRDSLSAFMDIQYMDLHASSYIFSVLVR